MIFEPKNHQARGDVTVVTLTSDWWFLDEKGGFREEELFCKRSLGYVKYTVVFAVNELMVLCDPNATENYGTTNQC